MPDRHEKRITELEIKLTHQERLLDTLNEIVIEQRTEIDALKKRLEDYGRVLANLDEEPANEPPPHY